MSERNYWPHFIIGLVAFAVAMGVWTIRMAINNPVQLDNSFMMKYQDVDNNYYKIEAQAKKFDRLYSVTLENQKLRKGENTIALVVKDRDGHSVENAKVILLLTRPETTKYDKKVIAKYSNGKYVAKVDLPLEGRWNIVAKITIKDLTRYKTYKLSTRRIIAQKLKNS